MSATGSPAHVAAYLAAYTIGLAFTDRGDDDLVADLVDAAEGDRQRLEDAREVIRGMDVPDRRAFRRALDLVRRAVTTLTLGSAERRAHAVRPAPDRPRPRRGGQRPH